MGFALREENGDTFKKVVLISTVVSQYKDCPELQIALRRVIFLKSQMEGVSYEKGA
jgi:hypothetical protein